MILFLILQIKGQRLIGKSNPLTFNKIKNQTLQKMIDKNLSVQAFDACNYRLNTAAGQGPLLSNLERRIPLQEKQDSCVDIGWDAEQCLDFLEMLSSLLHAYGKSSSEDLELPAVAVRHLGFSMFEAVKKIREELEQRGGQQ